MGKKIALCLSGQARFVEEGYTNVISPRLIKDNDVDVFIHTWEIDDEQNGKPFVNAGGHNMGQAVSEDTIATYLDLYKPKKHIVEKQIEFTKGLWADRSFPDIRSDYGYSMLYSVYTANKLRQLYEKENNIEYDLVVRCRTDFIMEEEIYLSKLENDRIYLPTGCPHVGGVADSFAIGPPELIDTYSDLYFYIREIMETTNIPLCWELLLYHHLAVNKIPVEVSIPHKLFR